MDPSPKLDCESTYVPKVLDRRSSCLAVRRKKIPMSQARPERADAVRNRRAILAATEELLATHRPGDISIERVALAAGVGKGTVFHRFGSRMGLMTALMIERAQALTEAVTSGTSPLGPGAPARERLLAFLDEVIEVVGRNKSLLAELAFSGVAESAATDEGVGVGEGTA